MSGNVGVIVAGAGIAGSSLAFQLSRRGVSTLLLEQEPAGPAGASSVPAALINPHRGRSGRASSADQRGAAAFWELARDLESVGLDSGTHRTGVLRLADNQRQARAWQRLADVQGPELRWLPPSQVPDCYHAPFGALLVKGGGWTESRKLLAALTDGAARHGAAVERGAELVGLGETAHGQVTALVRYAAHPGQLTPIRCRALVIATGSQQPAQLRLPRLELVWGQARVLELGFTPPYPLAGAVVAAFQDGKGVVSGGHVSLGRTGDDAGAPPPDTDLQQALAWQLPAAAQAPVLARWSGVRAKRPSGEPVARRLCPGVYLLGAFGGRGFLRAAAASARMAEGLVKAAGL